MGGLIPDFSRKCRQLNLGRREVGDRGHCIRSARLKKKLLGEKVGNDEGR